MSDTNIQKNDNNNGLSNLGNLLKLTDKIISDDKNKKIKLFAKHYFSLGLNVTCISNHITEHNFFNKHILKTPDHKWKHLLTQSQSIEELESYDWENATGVGCITGIRKIRAIDLDGCSDYDFLEKVLESLGLPLNYEWVVQTGSKNGFHIIIRANKFDYLTEKMVVTTFPPNKKNRHLLEKAEILWNTNLVLPPSIHSSGKTYEFINCEIPTALPLEVGHGEKRYFRNWNLRLGILNFIDTFLDVKKSYVGEGYGEILFEFIPPNMPSNLNDENILDIAEGEISCIVDIETDGLPKKVNKGEDFIIEYPNIIQIAWILLDKKGNLLKKESELINFIGIKQTEAYLINNIDINLVKRIGKDPVEVYKKFITDVKVSTNIVAHNSDFDIPIIKHQLLKYSLQVPFVNKRIVCTMKETVHFCNITTINDELKFPKLFELYEKLFNYKIEQRHNAESDVLLTAKCYKELVNQEIIKL
ncbi:MAG: bifunctional DNA primase/polymerase [Bacteroidetes bacterium]|nr:bifunctional DNA primase/polymerase [Bacteroidota bacterium]